ncbi:MAG: hypothetical protein ACRDTH_06815 [Pseudonocardiaceae bacterium]
MTRHPRPAPPASRAAMSGPSRRAPRITDHAGRLLLMQALRIAPFTHPDGNTIDAVTTTIWVLDGPHAPLRQQVTVMQKALVPALRCHLPGHPPLLARLLAHPHHQYPDRRIWIRHPQPRRSHPRQRHAPPARKPLPRHTKYPGKQLNLPECT